MVVKIVHFIFFVLVFTTAFGQEKLPARYIDIRFDQVGLNEAFTLFSEHSNLSLSYDAKLLPADVRVKRSFVHAPIETVLAFLLSKANLTYSYAQDIVILLPELKTFTISGRVKDMSSNEDLIGATIRLSPGNYTVNTNNYGFFSISIPEGDYRLRVSHLSYEPKSLPIALHSHMEHIALDMLLRQQNLAEVVVDAADSYSDSVSHSSTTVKMQWLKKQRMPYYKGEVDVIKGLQMEPGVSAVHDGSDHMFIRGGNKDHNLIMMDEAIIYNTGHLFGLNSIFNPDAINNIDLYKDALPANFGGRLSSVVDVRTAEGNSKTTKSWVGVSLLATRFGLEGPIVKDKSSFILTSRNSYLNLLNKDYKLFGLKGQYLDINGKVNYTFSEKDKLYYSLYAGNDQVDAPNGFVNSWGNITSTLRWNHLFNSKLFLNLSVVFSDYKNRLTLDNDSMENRNIWTTGIQDLTLKGDFTYYKNPRVQYQFGFNSIQHSFIPGESSDRQNNSNPRSYANEHALYFRGKQTLNGQLKIDYGLRLSAFQRIKRAFLALKDPAAAPLRNKGYYDPYFSTVHLEPRMVLRYQHNEKLAFHMGYAHNVQYLQLLQNDELAYSSLETWIPSSSQIKPQQAHNFNVGVKRLKPNGSFSVNGYYKFLNHQLQLANEAQLILNPKVEDQLRFGSGRAYGLELLYEWHRDKMDLNVSYTWSRALRKIDGVNKGRTFSANYDIPHSTKLQALYQLTKRIHISSFFTVMTGRPARFPIGYYENNGLKVPIYDNHYQFRMPIYHRLDLGAEWRVGQLMIAKRQSTHLLRFNVNNVYNNKYPLVIKLSQSDATDHVYEEKRFTGTTLGVNYTVKF